MAAYYKVEVSLNTNSVTVGSPSAQEVLVTLPLVGPAGATGATGATGASGASTWNEISGKPALFPPSAHDHQPGEVYADAAFVTQTGGSTSRSGIYLRNGTDNSRPVYESPTSGDYIWWDSNLDQWYLTSNTDVNLYYLDENADDFPWETDVVWNAIPPETGNIEVDQATLFDVSDYGSTSVIGLKTAKSGNASSTELVLGSDTRLTNSRTPSSTLAHASSHHTGGTDAIAPNNIGAAWALVLSNQTITGNTLLAAGRNRRITLFAVGATANVDLPYENNQAGDAVTLIADWSVASTLTVRKGSVMSGGTPIAYATLATLNASGQSFTFVSNGTATGWTLQSVSTHTHVAADITGLGTAATANLDALPETLRIVGSADATKKVAFEVDGIDAATTRTLTVPNSSGTIALNETFASPPAIGSTTPNTGAFTTLNANNGTLTASAPVLDLAQTWNSGGTTFIANQTNVTDTESSASSVLHRFNVGGTTVFQIEKNGTLRFGTASGVGRINVSGLDRVNGPLELYGNSNGVVTHNLRITPNAGTVSILRSFEDMQVGPVANSRFLRLVSNGTAPILLQSGNHTVEQYNTTNPQVFRIYNTFTDASNHERGFMRWSSNTLQIGSEKAGTGSARALEFQTDGTTRLTLASTGGVTVNTGDLVASAGMILGSNATVSPPTVASEVRGLQFQTLGGGTAQAAAYGSYVGEPVFGIAVGEGVSSSGLSFTEVAAFALNELTLKGNLVLSTKDLITDTTTGTKIGTATTQKLGFFNATPAVQPAAVADATDAASTQARLNDLLARLRTLGLIAT